MTEQKEVERMSAAGRPTDMEQDARDKDDPARLAEEARAATGKQAAEIRKQKMPIETEPPSVYRP